MARVTFPLAAHTLAPWLPTGCTNCLLPRGRMVLQQAAVGTLLWPRTAVGNLHQPGHLGLGPHPGPCRHPNHTSHTCQDHTRGSVQSGTQSWWGPGRGLGCSERSLHGEAAAQSRGLTQGGHTGQHHGELPHHGPQMLSTRAARCTVPLTARRSAWPFTWTPLSFPASLFLKKPDTQTADPHPPLSTRLS